MKQIKTKLYAKALADVLSKPASVKTTAWQEKIVDNFLKLLIKSGNEKKAKEIVALAEDLLLAKQGKRKIVFESARHLDAKNKTMLKEVAKEGDIVKEKINKELIAGIKIIINGSKQFDASMRKKLQTIF